MKKHIILILAFVICNWTYSQDYKHKFKTDICKCLETEIESRRQIRSAFNMCFNKVLPTYAAIIDASIEAETPTLKYQKGQLLRAELKLAFLSELVYSCDIYFQEIKSERQRQLATGRSRTYPSDLEKWNQMVAMQPLPHSYMQRAKTHFYLGNLKEAETDLRKSIEVNPYGQQGIYTRKEKMLLAWILEEQKRYTEAVTLYEESYAGNFDTEVLILKAMAHKKAGGTQATTMQIASKPTNNDVKKTSKVINKDSRRRSARVEASRKKETTKRTETTSRIITAKNTETKSKAKKEDLRALFKTKKTKTKKDNE